MKERGQERKGWNKGRVPNRHKPMRPLILGIRTLAILGVFSCPVDGAFAQDPPKKHAIEKKQIKAIDALAKTIYTQGTAEYSATVRNLFDVAGKAGELSPTAIIGGVPVGSPPPAVVLTKFDYDIRYTGLLRSTISQSTRIWVGEPVEDNEFSQVVAVIISPGYLCTGSVITKNVVITAAHCACIDTPRKVVVGNSTLSLNDVIVAHAYVPNGMDCNKLESQDPAVSHAEYSKGDIGILALQTPLSVAPTSLVLDSAVADNKHATIVGFGKTETGGIGVKNRADTLLVSDRCKGNVAGTPDTAYYGCVAEREIVAQGPGHVDTCGGDSGGPLFLKTKSGHLGLVAVTSRGVSALNAHPCGDGGIYARVDANVVWIKSYAPDAVVEQ